MYGGSRNKILKMPRFAANSVARMKLRVREWDTDRETAHTEAKCDERN